MNDIDCSYDDLLCRSLSLFRQFRLYDDRIEEDNAFVFLREAEKVVSDTRNGVCVAKLGCVIECLAHRFYINDDTDVILEEVDVFLIKFWKPFFYYDHADGIWGSLNATESILQSIRKQ